MWWLNKMPKYLNCVKKLFDTLENFYLLLKKIDVLVKYKTSFMRPSVIYQADGL